MNILLQPSSGKRAMQHFEDTITNGISLSYFKNKVSDEEFNKLSVFNSNSLKLWGFVPNANNDSRSEYINLNTGDIVLFYKNKSFYYMASVYLKIHNKKIAEDIWGNDEEGRTWEYIYFIKEGKQIEVPYKPEILEYKSNHIVQGAMLLKDEKAEAMLKFLEDYEGSVVDESNIKPTEQEEIEFTKKIKEPKTIEEAEDEIEKISKQIINEPVKERVVTAKLLVRNAKFSRLVKERSKYICEICGELPFLQKNGQPYAEAHHQFELAKTRIDNPHDMICVCPKCHKVIHFGSKDELEKRASLRNIIR